MYAEKCSHQDIAILVVAVG